LAAAGHQKTPDRARRPILAYLTRQCEDDANNFTGLLPFPAATGFGWKPPMPLSDPPFFLGGFSPGLPIVNVNTTFARGGPLGAMVMMSFTRFVTIKQSLGKSPKTDTNYPVYRNSVDNYELFRTAPAD
jgi:hypothetical protein